MQLDARDGFAHVQKEARKSEAETRQQIEKLIAEEPKYAGMKYGGLERSYGRQISSGTKTYGHMHQVPIEVLVQRNSEGGGNYQFIGNTCLVAIFQYWEDNYRSAIASELRVEPAQIQIPVFGEIRWLRHAIVHNRGITTTEVEKCERFRWFKRGEKILLSRTHFELIIDGILEALDEIKRDPQQVIKNKYGR